MGTSSLPCRVPMRERNGDITPNPSKTPNTTEGDKINYGRFNHNFPGGGGGVHGKWPQPPSGAERSALGQNLKWVPYTCHPKHSTWEPNRKWLP